LYRTIIELLLAGQSPEGVYEAFVKNPEFSFIVVADTPTVPSQPGKGKFSRDVKGNTFLREALPTAPKCPTCGGILHRNGMQVGHKQHKRNGGSGHPSNGQMQHPFCNSTVAQ
jgi:hypothetical protein